ncbi:MAG: hypothetical protein RLZZ450_4360 [Pseudomonadota bacterium]
MRNVLATLSLLAVSALCDTAQASGPVERLIQVLNDPSDPKHVVVRYGLASEGYLFSRDGGKSFKAMCSQAITPTAPELDKLKRLSGQRVPGAAATLLDTSGKLLVSQIEGLWSDDGTGCTWSKQPALDGMWAYSLRRDPKTPAELIAIVNTSTGEGDKIEAQSKLMRRAADGKWTTAGALKKPIAMQRAYGGDLVGASTATGTRLYASVSVSVGALTAKESWQIVTSEDGGTTWTEASTLPVDQQDGLTLLAVDPLEQKRVLAVLFRDNAPDSLLLSEDAGKTFKAYGDVGETRGVTFAPDGRVFLADAGDSGTDMTGGVWAAPKLGQPLSLLPSDTGADCVEYKSDVNKLQVCRGENFGLMDPATGAFEKLTSLREIPALLDCPGVDMLAVCQTQLNAGASWCCAGHYTATPFCGEYDITMYEGRRLYCGLSGRALDAMNGNGPADAGVDAGSKPAADAGKPAVRDGGTLNNGGPSLVDDEPRKRDAGNTDGTPTTVANKSDGCACAVPTTALSFGTGLSWTLAGLAMLLVRARRRPLFARTPSAVLRRAQVSARRST